MREKVDDIIARAREVENQEQDERKQVLQQRREVVIQRIAAAAEKYLSENGQGDSEVLVQARIEEVMRVRISHAEAIAEVTEHGDFSSSVVWWDIIQETEDGSMMGRSLWKGYVIEDGFSKKVDLPGDYLNVFARERAEGGFVAQLKGHQSSHVVVGVSDKGTADDAMNTAYRTYCQITGREGMVIPEDRVVCVEE